MSDRRRLNRIENTYGTDMFCTLEVGGQAIPVEVMDFNSFGIRLRLSDAQVKVDIGASIDSARIFYGTHLLGVFPLPTVVRVRESRNEIVLIPNQNGAGGYMERSERARVPFVLEPLIIGADPIRLKEQLIFRVENLSTTGFGAKCSLSNRHLLAGTQLENFKMILPGLGEINCSFRLSNVRPGKNAIQLGCAFLELDTNARKTIQGFLMLCMYTNAKEQSVNEEMLKKSGKLLSLIRVRRIDSEKDRMAVNELRFKAYSGANKLVENATVVDMQDDFDGDAMVLGAFIGPKLIGTFRIVFGGGGRPFPFEHYFPFPSVPGVTREQTVEVGKLAIDPTFQGSEILFRLFQTFAIETLPKRRYAVLLSTNSLAKNYVMIGASKIPGAVCDHPVLKNEQLQLFLIEAGKFSTGRMSALAWVGFAREVVDFMSTFGFATKTTFPLAKYVLVPMELGYKYWRRLMRMLKGKRK